MQDAAVEQRLQDLRHAADVEHVLGDVFAAGLQVGDVGRALEDLGDVEQVERRCRLRAPWPANAARRWSSRRSRRRRWPRSRTPCACRCRADGCPCAISFITASPLATRILVAAFVGSRRAGRTRQRETDRFGNAGHGVGGELAAAGAGARTGHALELVQLSVGHVAGRMHADALEHVLHGHVVALVSAGQDRAAVHEDGRHVEAQHRHHGAGQALVAAGDADEGIVAMAAHGEFDASRRSPRARRATTSCPGGPWRCRR